MIELLQKYQAKGYELSYMFTNAGNHIFEHYINGQLEFDLISESDITQQVNEYLCKLEDMK